jgi:hypothetical protein
MRVDAIAQKVCLLFAAFAVTQAHAATDRLFWNGFEPAISVPTETWTWVPFSNAQCGNGSTTGIGVNPTTLSNHLLIYLQEGGACWDAFSCALGLADNFSTGYGASNFAADAADTTYLALPGGFFDRSASANPFKDYSYVFVPYCTGDTHSGSNIVSLGLGNTAYFVGFRNMSAYLQRLASTFPDADHIVLAGSSAGGFGAGLNWWQTANAFPNARVDMIDDSGAIMPEDVLPSPNTREATQRANWNLAATLPPGCSACATEFDAIFAYYASAFPDSRGALLSFNPDTILPTFYNISNANFSKGLGELETQQFDPTTTLRYFQTNTSGHVLWFSPTLTVNGTSVQGFVTQMVTDDANWASVHP